MIEGSAFAIPSGDAASQYALDGAAVELFEDLRTHAKSFQPPEGEEALSCPLHDCAGVCGACDVDAKELEALDPLHYSPVDVDGDVLSPLFLVVHNKLLGLTDVEGLLSWHHTAKSLISSLYAVSSPSLIRPTTFVSSANLMMVLESCMASQSWLNREYRGGLKVSACLHTPLTS